MQHTSRRTLQKVSKLAAAGLSLGVVAAFGMATPASASPAPAGAYVSSSKATLVHVSALDARPLGVNNSPLVDLDIATAGSTINSAATPQSTSSAKFLNLSVAGQKVLDVPELSLEQVGTAALAANPQPLLKAAQALKLPLLNVGAGNLMVGANALPGLTSLPGLPSLENLTNVTNVTAIAGLPGIGALPSLPALGQTGLSLDSLTAIPGVGLTNLPVAVPGLGASMFEIPSLVNAKSRTELVKVEGQSGLGLASTSSVSLAEVVLLKGTAQQLTIKVISRPTLTVVTTGSKKSTVKYVSPILEVIDAAGNSKRIDAPDEVIEVPLAGLGATGALKLPVNLDGVLGSAKKSEASYLAKISIGHLTKKVTKTSVSASAATLRVEIGNIAGTAKLLDAGVGLQEAVAQVPAGGIGGESPEPSPSGDGDGDGSGDGDGDGDGDGSGDGNGGGDGGLPVTGKGLTLILLAGAGMVTMGMLARRFARRLH